MTPPISVSISFNEDMGQRGERVRKAIAEDERFKLVEGGQEPPFDLQFQAGGDCPPKCQFFDGCKEASGKVLNCNQWTPIKSLHVELKDFSEDGNSDYLGSILNGHLWQQILVARELQVPLIIVVLGDDNDVGAAIRKASGHGNQGHRVDPEKLMEYFRMVEGFEANCIALNIHVWRLKTDSYKRMLLRVRKILEGGDLSGFAPAPANGERLEVGLSIIAGRGVGPKKAASVLERFNVCLRPKDGFTGGLAGCKGIGPKLDEKIRKSIEVME
jgi:hypothetical protein